MIQLDLNKNIFQTLRWFDLFDYPLTPWEIWRFLWLEKVEYADVLEVLESGGIDGIESRSGFYFLSGRAEIIKIRQQRYYFTDLKFRRAARVSRLLKMIPWIRLIAVGNIIGAHNLKEDGDIDLFIIAEKGKLWLTRFFAVLFVKLLFLRPTGKTQKDKICLSFLVDESNLDLSEINLTPGPSPIQERGEICPDPYFIHWLAGLVPIFDPHELYSKFVSANSYIYKYLPNWQPGGLNPARDAGRAWPEWRRKMYNFLFSWLEKYFRRFQLAYFPRAIKELMNKDSRVMVGDGIIKLHVNDRRREYRERFLK